MLQLGQFASSRIRRSMWVSFYSRPSCSALWTSRAKSSPTFKWKTVLYDQKNLMTVNERATLGVWWYMRNIHVYAFESRTGCNSPEHNTALPRFHEAIVTVIYLRIVSKSPGTSKRTLDWWKLERLVAGRTCSRLWYKLSTAIPETVK